MKILLNLMNMKNLKLKLMNIIKIKFNLSLSLIGQMFYLSLVTLALVLLFFCLPYAFTYLG